MEKRRKRKIRTRVVVHVQVWRIHRQKTDEGKEEEQVGVGDGCPPTAPAETMRFFPSLSAIFRGDGPGTRSGARTIFNFRPVPA